MRAATKQNQKQRALQTQGDQPCFGHYLTAEQRLILGRPRLGRQHLHKQPRGGLPTPHPAGPPIPGSCGKRCPQRSAPPQRPAAGAPCIQRVFHMHSRGITICRKCRCRQVLVKAGKNPRPPKSDCTANLQKAASILREKAKERTLLGGACISVFEVYFMCACFSLSLSNSVSEPLNLSRVVVKELADVNRP